MVTAKPNTSLQLNGGFSGTFLGKKVGGIIGVNYANSFRLLDNSNNQNGFTDGSFFPVTKLNDKKYIEDINLGAIAGLSMFLNPLNKISYKAIINVKTANAYSS
jgi:hypothetical protein